MKFDDCTIYSIFLFVSVNTNILDLVFYRFYNLLEKDSINDIYSYK